MTLLGGEGPTIIAVMGIETFLGFVFVAARLYTRLVLKPIPLGWDDFTIIISSVLLAIYSFMCIAAATLGMGRHSSTLTTEQIAHANKIEIIGQTFCILGIATSKTSVALFLMRIVVKRWQQAILWCTIATLSLICVLCATIDFVQCHPVTRVWNSTVPGTCWTSITPWALATGGLSIAADFLLAILPWQIVYGLLMPKKDKLLIASSLSFGVFAAVCGIIRAIALQGLNARSDYTYETVGLILWSSTELMITIVTACIPTLRPLWTRFSGQFNSSYRHTDASDEPTDPSKNRPPFLSHHMRNLQRKNNPSANKRLDNTFSNTLFGTNLTIVDDDQKHDYGDEASGRNILASGGEMGYDNQKVPVAREV